MWRQQVSFLTIRMVLNHMSDPYNRRKNVLSVSLNKTFLSLLHSPVRGFEHTALLSRDYPNHCLHSSADFHSIHWYQHGFSGQWCDSRVHSVASGVTLGTNMASVASGVTLGSIQ